MIWRMDDVRSTQHTEPDFVAGDFLYVGNGRVVRYAGLAYACGREQVEHVSRARIAHGDSVRVRPDPRRFDPSAVVERARSRLSWTPMTFPKKQHDARRRPHPQLPGSLPTDRPLGENEEPPLGAHLVTPRLGFTHHGIYAGGGQVIHYGSFAESTRRRPVEQVPVARFAHRHSVWIRTDRGAAFNRKTVVYRARSRVGEDRYRLLSNNCEHFCEWCVHGENRSYQVERILNAWQWTIKKLLAFVATLLTANLTWSSAAHAQELKRA